MVCEFSSGYRDIKLKAIISKLDSLSEDSRAFWMTEILSHCGNKFGRFKYAQGFEQGLIEGFQNGLDEAKPKAEIPDYIDEWIEYCKKNNFNLLGALNPVGDFGEPIADSFKGNVQRCVKWALANSNTFADAWVNGYSVTKEKYYYVAIPVGGGVYQRLAITCSGELFLDSRNYHSIDKLIKHSRQSVLQITEGIIKESPLSWAWQFAKELECL